MSDLVDAETTLLTSLRDNITDPMTRGTNWIHLGATRNDERLPSIRVQRADEIPYIKALGTTDQFSDTLFRITIQVGLGNKTTISGTEYNDTGLLNYITALVVDHLKSVGKTIGSPIIHITRESAGGYIFNERSRRHMNVLLYRAFTID